VTRERLYIETMETILGNPETQKIILTDQAMDKAVPYLPLEQLLQPRKPAGPAAGTGQPEPARGGKGQ
jgi:membrane protease subunit HflK